MEIMIDSEKQKKFRETNYKGKQNIAIIEEDNGFCFVDSSRRNPNQSSNDLRRAKGMPRVSNFAPRLRHPDSSAPLAHTRFNMPDVSELEMPEVVNSADKNVVMWIQRQRLLDHLDIEFSPRFGVEPDQMCATESSDDTVLAKNLGVDAITSAAQPICFGKCQRAGKCKPDIEGLVWQGLDNGEAVVKIAQNNAFLMNDAYMFCHHGQGLLYLDDSGQHLPVVEDVLDESIEDEIVEENVGFKNPLPLTMEQLNDFGFVIDSSGLQNLNRVLTKYKINNNLRISFFMGQVAHETFYGVRTLEYGGINPVEYFNNKYHPTTSAGINLGNLYENDGSRFRGAGYLQITGRWNYTAFSNYVGNPNIVDQGYELVGGTYTIANEDIAFVLSSGDISIGPYAWEASGWFWCIPSINGVTDLNIAADNADPMTVLNKINFHDHGSVPDRNRRMNNFYRILTGEELGLPE